MQIQWNPFTTDSITRDPSNCPDFKGVFNSEGSCVKNSHNWDKQKCQSTFEGCPYLRDVLISGVSALRVPLYINNE